MSALWSLAAGVGAAGSILWWTGVLARWPWRVLDLGEPARRPSTRRRRPRTGRSRAARRDRSLEALERDLPATADLLRLAVSAGHSLHTAVVEVARSGKGPCADALASAVDGFERGGRLVDEIERLPRTHGAPLRPLTTTLIVAAESGTALGPALERLAHSERRRLRRRVEGRVRRLPVLLLGPLVGLILPAFVLLTVVPVGLTTARTALAPVALPPDGPDPRNPP